MMMMMKSKGYLLVFFITIISIVFAEEGSCEQEEVKDNDACTLYIAPSTLNKNNDNAAGRRQLGIFSAMERMPGEVLPATDDVCLPFIDTLYWHHPIHYNNPFHESFWPGRTMGMGTESTPTGTVEALCAGLPCTLNCHVGLVNVWQPVPSYDEASLHRARHATAGARTPYGVRPTTVARHIPAGGELFQFYDNDWFAAQRRHYRYRPFSDDYMSAKELLQQFTTLVYNQTLVVHEDDLYQKVMEIRNQPKTSRILNAMPDLLQNCLTAADDVNDGTSLQARHTQSLSWLQEHGRCIDHIASGPSTIPGAGKGAFARRNLKRGQVITTSPLHHYAQLQFDVMDMYNITQGKIVKPGNDNDDNEKREEVDDKGEEENLVRYQRQIDHKLNDQIALNYCFGHPDTSLLLCPYGSGVNFINHAEKRKEANVMIRWAKGGFAGHNDKVVQSASLEELDQMTAPTLSFDYVATKDIEKGEELFMWYGVGWEDAFLEFIHEWDDPQRTQNNGDDNNNRDHQYASAKQWNRQFTNVPIRTEEEQVMDPYPDHIDLRCHHDVAGGSSPGNSYQWKIDEYGLPCTIIDRFTAGEGDEEYHRQSYYLYTVDVEIWPQVGYDGEISSPNEVKTAVRRVLRTDIPRHALRFFDVPGTSDLHRLGTFRHWIGLPNDMLPDQWRNRVDDEEEEDEEDYDEEE